jgi:ribosomal protein L34E
MGLVTRRRPRIGDVIEIETPKGLAYAQYTYKHDTPPRYGALLRVLPGLYEARPSDFSDLVQQDERFYVFFPLGSLVPIARRVR